jgi:hypothetical protein
LVAFLKYQVAEMIREVSHECDVTTGIWNEECRKPFPLSSAVLFGSHFF